MASPTQLSLFLKIANLTRHEVREIKELVSDADDLIPVMEKMKSKRFETLSVSSQDRLFDLIKHCLRSGFLPSTMTEEQGTEWYSGYKLMKKASTDHQFTTAVKSLGFSPPTLKLFSDLCISKMSHLMNHKDFFLKKNVDGLDLKTHKLICILMDYGHEDILNLMNFDTGDFLIWSFNNDSNLQALISETTIFSPAISTIGTKSADRAPGVSNHETTNSPPKVLRLNDHVSEQNSTDVSRRRKRRKIKKCST